MIYIIVAGSREFDDYSYLEKILKDYLANIDDVSTVAIVSGAANGADSLGERFSFQNNINLIRCPADWKRYGRAAGPKRNEEMAAIASANDNKGVLFAFWNGESKGTLNMIKNAQKYKLEIHIIKI